MRVVGQRRVRDDLNALERRTVVYLDKGKCFRVAPGAHPSLQEDRVVGGGGVDGVFDKGSCHGELRSTKLAARVDANSESFRSNAEIASHTKHPTAASLSDLRFARCPSGAGLLELG